MEKNMIITIVLVVLVIFSAAQAVQLNSLEKRIVSEPLNFLTASGSAPKVSKVSTSSLVALKGSVFPNIDTPKARAVGESPK